MLSGGFNPTGTITFTLYTPAHVAVYTDVVTVNGNGTYTTATGTNPGGYLPTVTGTYLWSATYSGDANNNAATDNGQNENEAVSPGQPGNQHGRRRHRRHWQLARSSPTPRCSPAASTPPAPSPSPSTSPSNVAVYTDVVTVNGNGTYTTATGTNPGGYLPTADRHLPLVSHLQRRLEQQLRPTTARTRRGVSPASPAITTTPSSDQHRRRRSWRVSLRRSASGTTRTARRSSTASTAAHFHSLWATGWRTTSRTCSAPRIRTPGPSLAGLTNAQVATVYLNLWTPSGLQKNTYVQAFAVALGLYADTTSLGGQSLLNNGLAAQYGFVVTASGHASTSAATGRRSAWPTAQRCRSCRSCRSLDSNFNPSTGLLLRR